MFAPMTLVRLVALKAVALPGHLKAPVMRHASRSAREWTSLAKRLANLDNRHTEQQDVSKKNLDKDPVEARLESLVNEERRRWKTTKFHMMRRKMSERGAPERKLSWDAIEQIRYLKQESPQEWTLERLADSFSVTPEVISRVLRSKFNPTPERRVKQDLKVLATIIQPALGEGNDDSFKKDKPRLAKPDGSVSAMLSSGNTSNLTAVSSGTLAPVETEMGLVPSGGNVTSPTIGASQKSLVSTVSQSVLQRQSKEKEESMEIRDGKISENAEEEDEERVFLTEEELEELIYTLHEQPSAVQQKGREVFDSEGNFLYRI